MVAVVVVFAATVNPISAEDDDDEEIFSMESEEQQMGAGQFPTFRSLDSFGEFLQFVYQKARCLLHRNEREGGGGGFCGG